jgi:hypothetical protein
MVSSMRRILANRRNALKSTGPRTARGKARAAMNGLTHGIFSKRLFLPGEPRSALIRLHRRVVNDLQPRNQQELDLVNAIVMAKWKLRRLKRVGLSAATPHLDRVLGYEAWLEGIVDRSFFKLVRLREEVDSGIRSHSQNRPKQ